VQVSYFYDPACYHDSDGQPHSASAVYYGYRHPMKPHRITMTHSLLLHSQFWPSLNVCSHSPSPPLSVHYSHSACTAVSGLCLLPNIDRGFVSHLCIAASCPIRTWCHYDPSRFPFWDAERLASHVFPERNLQLFLEKVRMYSYDFMVPCVNYVNLLGGNSFVSL
jgi:hypothetical protein